MSRVKYVKEKELPFPWRILKENLIQIHLVCLWDFSHLVSSLVEHALVVDLHLVHVILLLVTHIYVLIVMSIPYGKGNGNEHALLCSIIKACSVNKDSFWFFPWDCSYPPTHGKCMNTLVTLTFTCLDSSPWSRWRNSFLHNLLWLPRYPSNFLPSGQQIWTFGFI